ncbi:iron-containing alcohol dehydrogenase [Clostridium sp. BL-8]|uniref:iron-containing alcohol dehydrogenase n=1 Tax=Clostridium sp. BL-8 TaxID=349938 RepID=UPI00098CC705|nr:iron-containing alcohol dehydrogenase [Clostridium sp. BL-8]OOM78876.1 alcohol dehydrogenase [Clostridium sp. BL-8]
MLDRYNLKMPHAVYSGENSLENIKTILLENRVNKLAVFTDKGIESAGLLDYPMNFIKETGVEIIILDELPAEPTYGEVQKLVDQFKESKADFIMAVGGGSVIDTAKLASILVTDEYGVYELLDQPKLAKKCIKTLVIPTTAGTGAEATPNAIVAVPERELKIGIVNEEMISDYVILDAIMIKKLPRKIAAATGVDALAHAIECFTGNKANPFSDIFALEALDIILNNIISACDDAEAMEAKNKMQIASFYAGVAITASGTTAVHALSYPLGGKYHIAHGVSNAILLAPVMRFNEPVCREKFAIAYDRCVHGEKACTSIEEKSEFIIKQLEHIVKHLDIPTSLSTFGVPASDLDVLVKAGMEVTRLLDNNMRKVTPEDARALYKSIL